MIMCQMIIFTPLLNKKGLMISSVKSFTSKPIDNAFVIVFWGESNCAFVLQMPNSL